VVYGWRGHAGIVAAGCQVCVKCERGRRWERARAEVYGDAVGSSVVVANSLVIGEILRSPRPVGTVIAVASGHAAVGHASEPDDVVVFALDGDGPRIAHERG